MDLQTTHNVAGDERFDATDDQVNYRDHPDNFPVAVLHHTSISSCSKMHANDAYERPVERVPPN